MKGPLLRLALRLQRDLTEQRRVNQRQAVAYARVLVRCDVLSRELEATRRDVELLALMAPDRRTALGFVRDQHTIEKLGEG